MQSLVGNGAVEDSDSRTAGRLAHERDRELLQGLTLGDRGHQNQFRRLACENALQRRAQFLEDVVDRGYHNRDIFGSERGLGRNWLRLVCPMTDAMNKQSEIAVTAGSWLARARRMKYEDISFYGEEGTKLTIIGRISPARRVPSTIEIASSSRYFVSR